MYKLASSYDLTILVKTAKRNVDGVSLHCQQARFCRKNVAFRLPRARARALEFAEPAWNVFVNYHDKVSWTAYRGGGIMKLKQACARK